MKCYNVAKHQAKHTTTTLYHYCWDPKQDLCKLNNCVVTKQKCIDYIEKMTINDLKKIV